MSLRNANSADAVSVSLPAPTIAPAVREAYETPVLIRLGDVRDLTLGGSPGSGDSGDPGAQRF
jgi:hypothetical protein